MVRVKEEIERQFSNVEVRSFATRSALEPAWERRRPEAAIIDLMVPERYVWIAHSLFGLPPEWARAYPYHPYRWIKKLIALFLVWISGLYADYLPTMRATLESERRRLEYWKTADKSRVSTDVIRGQSTYWGGLEFLRDRIFESDQSDTPFYIYSLAINEEYMKRARLQKLTRKLAEVCGIVRAYVEGLEKDEILKPLNIYAKGYIEWGQGRGRVNEQSDMFNKLIRQLEADLKLERKRET